MYLPFAIIKASVLSYHVSCFIAIFPYISRFFPLRKCVKFFLNFFTFLIANYKKLWYSNVRDKYVTQNLIKVGANYEEME